MKILWHSNAGWGFTGYANQTDVFTRLLRDAGHQVAVSAFYGLDGAVLQFDDMPVLPAGREAYGNDVLKGHAQFVNADLVWTLIDAWVIHPSVIDALPMAMWAPIDSEPIPPQVAEALRHARWPVAYSRFGEREMRKAGLDPLYVPHGIDTEIYQPKDRAAARERWGVPDDAFFVAMVATNKGYPSRKSLARVIKAWATFEDTHPDAMLYLHSLPLPVFEGLDLLRIIEFYGVRRVRLPDTPRMVTGGYTNEALCDLYNAADVLLSPSMGEGFGLPVVEAQACGCPVIVSDFSAQPELCFGGYKIPVGWADRVWTYQDSEQCQIKPRAIVTALEWAFAQRGNEDLRNQAREGALIYDARRVFTTYMQPVLAQIEAEMEAPRETVVA